MMETSFKKDLKTSYYYFLADTIMDQSEDGVYIFD